MLLPGFIFPVRPLLRRESFSHPDWLYELKHDGFRALAYVQDGACRLVSRNAHHYRRFGELCAAIAQDVRATTDAVLDGEIVCLDPDCRSNFKRLLFRRGEPHYYAFDLLWLDGADTRSWPLVARKRALKRIMPPRGCCM